ncbi:MAG: hypothetical protein EOO01_43075 [Chitinophagaceae bacterium]|nr:MAG: hypothetical protein EOO01_43075 [Chitinophagaceae bacterium]
MKSTFLFFLLSLSLVACQNGKDKLVIRNVTDSVVEEDPGPPEPPFLGQAHRYASLQDWLGYLCDSIKPTPEIVAYFFTLSVYPEGYSALFTGNKAYNPVNRDWIFMVDDRVQDFYPLPKASYNGLTREAVLKKFATELTAFSTTEKFKQSFFGKAKAVGAGFDREEMVLIK